MYDLSNNTRPCARCKIVKPLDQFKKDNRRRGGIASYCKECENKAKKVYMREYNRRPKRLNRNREQNRLRRGRKSIPVIAGYIYLMRMNDIYKIGKTTNLLVRYSTIKGTMPYPVDLVHSIKTDNAVDLELRLHDHFAHCRLNGEWFALTPDDVQIIKKM